MRKIRTAATALVMVGVLAGCGGDEEEPTTADATTTEDTAGSGDTDTDSDEGTAPEDEDVASSGGSGTLELDGESIAFDEVLCYLQEQEAAAGGGKILFVVQGMGTDAAGEDVMLDVSRFDEDSMFAGDMIDVAVGDVMSGDSVSYTVTAETGTVTLDGETASADGVMLMGEGGSEVEASFDVTC